VAHAQRHFSAVLALDGSTLDVLLRKVGLLRGLDKAPLAGRIAALLDIASHLPREVWYEDDSQAHDQRFWERVIATLPTGVLLIFDLGFLNYPLFDRLTEQGIGLITRAKHNTAYRGIIRVLRASPNLRDRIVWLGVGENQCVQPMLLIKLLHQGKWYRYLTNVLDPAVLPTEYVVALYWQRWRIEDALDTAKRLLGLAYFWVGSNNGVQMQVWATWLLYAVLVDITDAVAEELARPYRDLSLEMVYRGLYHFTQAYHRGNATDPVKYLAAKAKELAIIKPKRHSTLSQLLGLTAPQVL
jgi:Transposase DDE domain.